MGLRPCRTGRKVFATGEREEDWFRLWLPDFWPGSMGCEETKPIAGLMFSFDLWMGVVGGFICSSGNVPE